MKARWRLMENQDGGKWNQNGGSRITKMGGSWKTKMAAHETKMVAHWINRGLDTWATYCPLEPLDRSWLYCSAICLYCSSGCLYCSAGCLHCSTCWLYCSAGCLYCSTGCLYCSAGCLNCSAGCLYCSPGCLNCPSERLYRSSSDEWYWLSGWCMVNDCPSLMVSDSRSLRGKTGWREGGSQLIKAFSGFKGTVQRDFRLSVFSSINQLTCSSYLNFFEISPEDNSSLRGK